MTPIDLSKSLVGELYPLTANASIIGQLGFAYKETIMPYCDAWICTVGKDMQRFRWRITPLRNNEVLISCTHPKTQKTFVLGSDNSTGDLRIRLCEWNIPAYEEEIIYGFTFQAEYVDGSPLFIRIKRNGRYISSMGEGDTEYDSYGNYPIGIYYDESFFPGYPKVESWCTWYLELDEARTGVNALKGYSNLKPFDALTKRFCVDINESFLQGLSVK